MYIKARKRKVASPFQANSALNRSAEAAAETSSAPLLEIEDEVGIDEDLMTAMQAAEVDFLPIDHLVLAAADLYGDPATESPRTAVSKRHLKDIVEGNTIWLWDDGSIWHQPRDGLQIFQAEGVTLATKSTLKWQQSTW